MNKVAFILYLTLFSRVVRRDPPETATVSNLDTKPPDERRRCDYAQWKRDSPEKTLILELKPLETTNLQRIENYISENQGYLQNSLARDGIASLLILKYLDAFQGFAVYIDHPHPLPLVESMELPDVNAIYVDQIVKGDTPEVRYGAGEWQFTRLFHTFESEGVKVAVIDQGIPYTHPAFVEPGEECTQLGDDGCRVKVVEDFVDLDLEKYNQLPLATRRPGLQQDTVYGSHGVAMAAIIGGTDPTAPGIAREAHFYDYRAMDHDASAPLSLVLAAVELAIRDEVDILSLSLSSRVPSILSHTPRFKRNTHEEILVTTSIGNFGRAATLFRGSHLANVPGLFHVGAMESHPIHTFVVLVELPEVVAGLMRKGFEMRALWRPEEFSPMCNDEAGFPATFQHTFDEGVVDSEVHDASHAPNTVLIVFCSHWDDCHSALSILHIHDPVAVLLACAEELEAWGLVAFPFPIGQLRTQLTALRTLASHASQKRVYLRAGAVRPEQPRIDLPEYSSQGPSVQLALTPDFLTFGEVLAITGDPELPYDFFRGASVATAGCAGMLALAVREWRERDEPLTFQKVLQRAQNTAVPLRVQSTTTQHGLFVGLAYPAFRQGAGALFLDPFLDTRISVDPPRLELKAVPSQARWLMKKLTIDNRSDRSITYVLHHLPAFGLIPDAHHAFYHEVRTDLDVAFSLTPLRTRVVERIHVVAGKQQSFYVHFLNFDTNPRRTFVNGYLQLVPHMDLNISSPDVRGLHHSFHVVSVPYFFYYGNFKHFPTITLRGREAAFLTDTSIEPYCHTYLSYFGAYPVYTFEFSDMPHFTFTSPTRPVVSLCFRFQLKHVTFYLYDFHARNKRVGRIAKYSALSDVCHLFFLTPQPIPQTATRAGPDHVTRRSDAGWDWTVTSPEAQEPSRISPGIYTICAHTLKLKDKEMKIEEYVAWCSVPFEVTG